MILRSHCLHGYRSPEAQRNHGKSRVHCSSLELSETAKYGLRNYQDWRADSEELSKAIRSARAQRWGRKRCLPLTRHRLSDKR